MSFLDAGIPVTLVAHGRGALEGGVALIRRTYESQVRQRTLAEYKYAVRMAFLSTTTNDADIASADVVIESCAGGRGTSSDA
ncbi:hypothetical protein A4W93_06450 [Piscinibacter gummiphilus]|uniref:3-hydroxyacyl-CoA dehydrogenase NAD binding domain-containing protein n=2 Tax=Piscinibacter gummiphilus TaxID=946333 RepID=A0A1W6L5P1_9BURK|nr:hypothetical protein A4W93_06450 [Piscinibacter gummiphilus]